MIVESILPVFFSAFVVGFLGSGHCVGMCGGIASLLGTAVPNRSGRWQLLLAYNIGRLSTYTFLGVLVGWLISLNPHFLHQGHGFSVMRLLAGLLLIALGLYLAGIWYGLVWLEKAGGILWRKIQPVAQKLIPVKSMPQAAMLGILWGWLPCGLVYSALAVSATQANWLLSGLSMLAFGVGTLPSMFTTGYFAAQTKAWVQKKSFRLVMGLLVILMGIWVLLPLLRMSQHH